jgi:hypothetical protein
MSVGSQPSKAAMDQTLTNLATRLRDLAGDIRKQYTFINNGAAGNGVSVLSELGYDNVTASAPGNQTDAAYANYILNQLNAVAALYYGETTQAAVYNYNNALAPMWAGQ